MIEDLIALRHKLHQMPELSGQENETINTLCEFIMPYHPTKIIKSLGKTGMAVVFGTGTKTLLLRADVDALPIQENNMHNHISLCPGKMHACGHDGHSTMLAGVVPWITTQDLKDCRVVLVFQPAEEIGKGAKDIIHDEKFADLTPNYSFALHNIPGYELGQVLLRQGVFASSSVGMIVSLQGYASHASEPNHGVAPTLAMAQIIQSLSALPQFATALHEATQVTIVYAKLGEIRFGTSPETAVVMATLRAHESYVLETVKQKATELCKNIATAYGLKCEIQWQEYFPSTKNNDEAMKLLTCAVENMNHTFLQNPFPWSEDFGYFTECSKGAMFGLGSGVNSPSLHNENYDFPDDLISYGVNVFKNIVQKFVTL